MSVDLKLHVFSDNRLYIVASGIPIWQFMAGVRYEEINDLYHTRRWTELVFQPVSKGICNGIHMGDVRIVGPMQA